MQKPEIKPNHPFFSSGPCSKRPGWSLNSLNNAFLGRSHRAKNGKAKLNEVIVKSKELLELIDYEHFYLSGEFLFCLLYQFL